MQRQYLLYHGSEFDIPEIDHFGFRRFADAESTRPHTHSGPEVTFALKGELKWLVGDKQLYTAKKNNTLIIKNGATHSAIDNTASSCELIWFAFNPKIKYRFSSIWDSQTQCVKTNTRINAALDEFKVDLNEYAIDSSESNKHVIKHSAYKIMYLLLQLLTNTYSTEDKLESESNDLLVMKEYIEKSYMLSIGINDLGKLVGKSTVYVWDCFNKFEGTSPAKFIRNVRLSHCRTLLISSSKNITEIATECGFCDSHYFSKIFKCYFGLPPSEYRAKVRQKNKTP